MDDESQRKQRFFGKLLGVTIGVGRRRSGTRRLTVLGDAVTQADEIPKAWFSSRIEDLKIPPLAQSSFAKLHDIRARSGRRT